MKYPLIEPDVEAVFSDWKDPDLPGGAVAVLKNRKLIHYKGYGSANLERRVPFGPKQKFCIASVTKQFTTFCILLLEEQGKLTLDDDVRRYFPELADFGTSITIRHLCHNCSGIRDYIAFAPLSGGQLLNKLPREFILQLITNQRTLNFSPGSQYRYSNSNFVILSVILERLNGLPLGEVFSQCVFEPLGMHDSLLVDDPTQRPEGSITPYRTITEGDDGQTSHKPWEWDIHGSGDGGVWSTMNDMVLWELNFDDNVIGSSNLTERLTQTSPLNDGAANNYALGMHTGIYRGARWHGHGGGFEGFMSQRTRFPDDALSVIIFANHSDNLIDRTYRVADSLLENPLPINEPMNVDFSPTEMRERLGFYQDMHSGIAFDLGLANGELNLEIAGFPRRLIPETESFYRPDPRSAWRGSVEIGPLEPRPKLIVEMEQGWRMTATKSRDPQGDLEAFVGVFYNNELRTTYSLEAHSGALLLTCDGWGGQHNRLKLEQKGVDSFVLSKLAKDRWLQDGEPVFWFPEPTGSGRNNLLVSAYGAEGIQFNKVAPSGAGS